jgi:hypothetical protein
MLSNTHNKLEAVVCDIDINYIRKLGKLLNRERSDCYETWLQVGSCFHNINYDLLDSWIEFSSLSPKFKEGECEQLWSNMDSKSYGIYSLNQWAHHDNKKKYNHLIDLEILQDLPICKTPSDIASIIYKLYKYQYKCTSIKNDIWYEFNYCGEWVLIKDFLSLYQKLNEQIVNQFLKVTQYYNSVAKSAQNEESKSKYTRISRDLTYMTFELLDHKLKVNIINECKILFFDAQLDQNLRIKILNDNSNKEIEKELLVAFLEEDKNELKTFHSYIYIIEGMDMNTNRRFYKIGETQRHPINRMKEHGLYHRLILMEFVCDSIKVEQDILKILRNNDHIISRHDLGKEYFECKDDDTIKGILREYLSNVCK